MPPNPTEVQETLVKPVTGGPFKYRHFVVGFVIMFVYMGAEAILYQLMTPYLKEPGQISNAEVVRLSSIIFYALMASRLLVAIADSYSLKTSLLVVVIPLMATSLYGFLFNKIETKST